MSGRSIVKKGRNKDANSSSLISFKASLSDLDSSSDDNANSSHELEFDDSVENPSRRKRIRLSDVFLTYKSCSDIESSDSVGYNISEIATGSSDATALDHAIISCDTASALKFLSQEFYGSQKHSVNSDFFEMLVLENQLYTVFKNRTAVDRELNQLCQSNTVRKFKLLINNEPCHAVIDFDIYVRVAAHVLCPESDYSQVDQKSSCTESACLALKLLVALLDQNRDMHVSKVCIESSWKTILGLQWSNDACSDGDSDVEHKCAQINNAGNKVKDQLDDIIRILAANKFLLPRRDIKEEGGYWFMSPMSCRIMTYLPQVSSNSADFPTEFECAQYTNFTGYLHKVYYWESGRMEVLKLFPQKRYRERRKSDLLKLKLKTPFIGMKFLLRDLESLGQLNRIESPSGLIYKLSN